jgi:transposase InsO family protein
LVKTYASQQETTRYSPATITGCEKTPRFGNPDMDKVCTSHVERFNLTVRMQVRRFTRLTNAHSKSPKHHVAMQAIFFAWYNFCRKHQTLKGQTPAMAAGLADKAWSIRELLEDAAIR